ncbi:hypothetical protein GCK72_007569 [Caenorhabditis remanei]|uniref:BTB domain-containing protein n=1 Tax=Caenorhabditis remanei TaxID=31234 RepID=A0A6A5HHM6_CAERE|nr:hypothetical protein GCK72_007569 [Caenorhabditis remanei]KAF1767610.1 hypothetical protein GCK72_007569 [Caenorhabditis remanei]
MSDPSPRGTKRKGDAPAHPTAPKKRNPVAFDESDPDLYDVILAVEEKKFYVNKKQLALHSMFFHRMFYGGFEETKKEEIEIKDVSADDFQKFLEVVHGLEYVNDSIVEELIELADRFDCEHILKKCKEHLMGINNVSSNKLLRMAVRYDMKQLKENVLSKVTTTEEAIDLYTTNEFDEETMNILLDKSFGITSGFASAQDDLSGVSAIASSLIAHRLLAAMVE